MTRAVRLTDGPPAHPGLDGVLGELDTGTGPASALALVRRHPEAFPPPGRGATSALWETLSSVAATSLTAARSMEPHLDALAILDEARGEGHEVPEPTADSTWGVFAAEGPGVRLAARDDGGGTRLSGTKPWCSLAGTLSHALVTARDGETTRRLYAVPLGQANGVAVEPATWFARGLTDVTSGPVNFDDAVAAPVGPTGWYLERPGFAWGAMGVAAIWYGGAVGVARRLVRGGREPDQIALMHLGAVDASLWAARAALADAAARVDEGRATGPEGAALALRVRHVVARAAEAVLEHVGHATGPAPLALEDDHARRVADLQLYLRQEHAERDAAALGRHLIDAPLRPPW